MTPGEVARVAVEDAKLPAGPVERLRDAYRDVSYGGVDPAEREGDATAAVDAIDADAGEDQPRSDDGDGGETA